MLLSSIYRLCIYVWCVLFINSSRNTCVFVFYWSIMKLSNMKSACYCYEPSLHHMCFLGADHPPRFFSSFSQHFCQTLNCSTRERAFTRQVPQSCHPQASAMAAAPGTSFAALLHSLLLLLCAPGWGSFQESCLWLLAVETVLKAGVFFPFSELPLLADNGRYVYADSVFLCPQGLGGWCGGCFTAGSQ